MSNYRLYEQVHANLVRAGQTWSCKRMGIKHHYSDFGAAMRAVEKLFAHFPSRQYCVLEYADSTNSKIVYVT